MTDGAVDVTGAAGIDELLSDAFEPSGDPDPEKAAVARLTAWCASSTAGDWSLFARRLRRDGLDAGQVLARFGGARLRPGADPPAWVDDAAWVRQTMCAQRITETPTSAARYPFDDLIHPLVDEAERRLHNTVGRSRTGIVDAAARVDLRELLTRRISGVLAPALYLQFATGQPDYRRFIETMRSQGLQQLFGENPVMLRLVATVTRQWVDAAGEFLHRLDADRDALARLLGISGTDRVRGIAGALSDPHHGGRSVLCVQFGCGARVMYKPRDLRADTAWQAMVERLNRDAPVRLRAVRTLARNGYGWSEFVEHTGCDTSGVRRFFVRAGALLALLHGFAAADIHQENLVAAGDHPVPIDLETLLQAAPDADLSHPASAADERARARVADSVLAVGLLPGYARAPDDQVYPVGGVASGWAGAEILTWQAVNSDAMRPVRARAAGAATPNLPHVAGEYARLADHVDDFLRGYRDYAKYLAAQDPDELTAGFAGVPVRRVLRPTRFYGLLLRRLTDHTTMDDGAIWSAQADFVARLANWETEEPLWALQRAERTALLRLDVPRFEMLSDGCDLGDEHGPLVATGMTPGLQRARARLRGLDAHEIAWQAELIGQTVAGGGDAAVARPGTARPEYVAGSPAVENVSDVCQAADAVAAELCRIAIRAGGAAAWIGTGWVGDSDVAQPAVLGHDLYNGTPGIAVFLAAHARVRQAGESSDLARAAVAHLRAQLRSANAPHLARVLGLGGAVGLGSLVYALTVMSDLLGDEELRADADRAAALMTGGLAASDRRLDVIGGSAGAILCLLRLHRDTARQEHLDAAVRCGEHLLGVERAGAPGRRSWRGYGPHGAALNGMSHGAAGFAYALSALASATGRADFAAAATECLEFGRGPEIQGDEHNPARAQWCRGAVGVGLARLGMVRRGAAWSDDIARDVDGALAAADHGWPGAVDTLCCGSLGSVELWREAAARTGRPDGTAHRRLQAVLSHGELSGDFRWNAGTRRFNVGLFRGIAGVGYTCLRDLEGSLPNLLIWE